jgi:predicted murein hydrolase (TIGR00659 family)
MHDILPLPIFHIWVYLQTQPLLWLTVTLCIYELARELDRFAGHKALTNPTVLAIMATGAVLLLTHTSYQTYFAGAVYIHFLLGPATVALAVPMYANRRVIRLHAGAILASLTLGSLTAMGSALFFGRILGATHPVLMSLGPKSVTSPIAMGIAQALGGIPSLAAVFVMITAMFGLLVFPFIFRLVGITDWRAKGLAMGTALHGLGTARMIAQNETAGAFAGLAMGLNGLFTAIVLPLVVTIFGL